MTYRFRNFFWGQLIILMTGSFVHGQKMLEKAYELYDAKSYCEAIPYFDEYLSDYSDPRAMTTRGLCLFHCHQPNLAISDFENASFLGYDRKELNLYLALCHRHLHDFDQAILYYKKYLADLAPQDNSREEIILAIKQCALGIELRYQSKLQVLENMGALINSGADEINILESPNTEGKFYFTRFIRALGQYIICYFSLNEDMKEETGYLNPAHDHVSEFLVDLSSTGEKMYLARYFTEAEKFLLLENQYLPGNEPLAEVRKFGGPVEYGMGDRYFHLVNDSLIIFATDRLGGYGGMDLWLTGMKNGQWLVPVNLGNQINSAHDEKSPYTSRDGNELYFSSNREEVIGGYDIFRSAFNKRDNEWKQPENLGYPFNSAGDDMGFRLSFDGSSAFFSSDRKTSGQGGFDLYRVYLSEPLPNQPDTLIPSFLASYSLVPERAVDLSNKSEIQKESDIERENNPGDKYPDTSLLPAENQSKIDQSPVIINSAGDTLYMHALGYELYGKNGEIIWEDESRLKELAQFMLRDASLKVSIVSHCHPGQSRLSDLIQSLKTLEKTVEFLLKMGVKSDQISPLAAGSFFPAAKTAVSPVFLEPVIKFNNRIEFIFDGDREIWYQSLFHSEIPHFLKDGQWLLYKSLLPGLSYKLKVVQLSYLENAPFLELAPDCMVEHDIKIRKNIVYSGIFRHFAQASQAAASLKSALQTEIEVVPFIDGKKIPEGQLMKMAGDYVDLINYLESR